ncbi:imidazole glycerol phosphate synthase subunit HisF [Aestuariispira ectoiniformans]|uniref:imidazole glycerol phosphate synthase subunit HisF n=1 Tax=Aestuariispira ectoiniformans TaxID=2775080 RepID=UPI00223BB51D|nr:imidazole glycerol phosphate synthase cyclase subunit [Aestuariispira ectoiniformans]
MLKLRIIPTLLFKDTVLVKSIQYGSLRRVGSARQAVRVNNLRNVDELLFVDIGATRTNSIPDVQLIDDIADDCFMPLTVGGGIKTLHDARSLFAAGADKITLNSAIASNPGIVQEIAQIFGSQAVVASIDVRCIDGQYTCYTNNGENPLDTPPAELAQRLQSLGAGEILLNSIDKDGTMDGYDLTIIKKISEATQLPIIASGGAGKLEHFAQAAAAGANALAAASLFHFTEITPSDVRNFLGEQGFNVRK